MRTAIATVCLSGGLDEKLQAVAAAGFKGVEIFENDLLSFNGTPRDVRRAVEDLGLSIVTFQPFRDFEGLPADRRDRAFARAERKFDLMHELGCELLMVCSNVSPESLGGIDRAAEDFHALGERAAKHGLRVGFEALAWGRHINDYRDAWEVVRRAGHASVGLVLDSFHILSRKTDLKPIATIPRDRIFLVQLADAPMLEMDYLSWSRHFRAFPGQGDFPVLDFMLALRQTGYDDLLSLEIFNDQFRAGSTRNVAIDGHRSMIYLLDQVREHTGEALVLPPRVHCLGTEFIEFAIDEANEAEFNTLLLGLGFARTGMHRSKSVTRWSQGDINFVVNTEKEGFAHSYYLTHGTSVCALCLRVDDAVATLRRASGLLDQPFHQAVGPGELEIPAVRGVGGSLIYFADATDAAGKLWDVDFTPTGETAADAGLRDVDHLAQSMHYEEMLSWLLFYSSLLDLDKATAQDVLDPGGLVRSQVVQSADGAMRIVLNASQSSRTLASRFLSELFGSGVQHIALRTGDIFATVEQLTRNGVQLLDIPENYYDDLEARTGLSSDELDRLKSLNILYDREGDAEFFQVYTLAFGDRFFFEIVQRRDYTGFGAANASIRLAAQTRLMQHVD
jgi:4-hydroxyphenylpyruvate dioxygenase